MTFWDRPAKTRQPDRLTPEQAAMLDLLARVQELEDMTRVERSIRVSFEIEAMERIGALEDRIKRLEKRA
jgi:hypothetical protein